MAGYPIVVAALVLACVAPAARAQSLGEIAKKEADRRGAVPAAGKVYTNDTLKPDPTAPPPPATAPPDGAAAEKPAGPNANPRTAEEAGVAPEDGTTPADQEGVTPLGEQEPQRESDKSEEYWRGRASLIRGRLAAHNRQIEALRVRMDSFSGANTPERDVSQRALDRALEDQRYLQQEWDRFERQARERGIPDAWIR